MLYFIFQINVPRYCVLDIIQFNEKGVMGMGADSLLIICIREKFVS